MCVLATEDVTSGRTALSPSEQILFFLKHYDPRAGTLKLVIHTLLHPGMRLSLLADKLAAKLSLPRDRLKVRRPAPEAEWLGAAETCRPRRMIMTPSPPSLFCEPERSPAHAALCARKVTVAPGLLLATAGTHQPLYRLI